MATDVMRLLAQLHDGDVQVLNTHPYPEPGSEYSDKVIDDSGGNFERIARISGLMDDWIAETMTTPLSGIEAKWWVKFLKVFDERGDAEIIKNKLDRLRKSVNPSSNDWADKVVYHVQSLMELK